MTYFFIALPWDNKSLDLPLKCPQNLRVSLSYLKALLNWFLGEQCEDYMNDDDCSTDDEFDSKVTSSTSQGVDRQTTNDADEDEVNPFGQKKKKKKRKRLETGLLREILKFKT